MARQSRKKRKRYRRRLQAEAIALGPALAGGWGKGSPVSRSDLQLVRRAIREGWPVSAEVKRLIIDDVGRIFDTAESMRLKAQAAQLVVAMESENQRAELKTVPVWHTRLPIRSVT